MTLFIFKNYFAIVFLVFNNKQYLNKPLTKIIKSAIEIFDHLEKLVLQRL